MATAVSRSSSCRRSRTTAITSCTRNRRAATITGTANPTPGYRGMHSFTLAIDRYFVPEENLVGGEAGVGRGFYLQMGGFAVGRLQTGGRATGVGQAALEKACNYALDRKQFGRPIADYQLTQHKIGRMSTHVAAGRHLTYAAARAMETDPPLDRRASMPAAMCKLFASDVAIWVSQEAQLIHGGWGYSEEDPVARYVVDALVLPIFEGVKPILELAVIARQLLAVVRLLAVALCQPMTRHDLPLGWRRGFRRMEPARRTPRAPPWSWRTAPATEWTRGSSSISPRRSHHAVLPSSDSISRTWRPAGAPPIPSRGSRPATAQWPRRVAAGIRAPIPRRQVDGRPHRLARRRRRISRRGARLPRLSPAPARKAGAHSRRASAIRSRRRCSSSRARAIRSPRLISCTRRWRGCRPPGWSKSRAATTRSRSKGRSTADVTAELVESIDSFLSP